jgi:hypothetical protein
MLSALVCYSQKWQPNVESSALFQETKLSHFIPVCHFRLDYWGKVSTFVKRNVGLQGLP